jgi:sn-glycerol 3-phosphate transport system permease protein
MFLLRQSFRSTPKDLKDAARLDGFGHLAFLSRVVVPLNRPVIGSLALITILTSWNTYLWPRSVTIKTEWQTLQLVLRQVSVQQPDQINVGVAAAIISAMPVLVVLIFFQKQIIRGLTAGAVKG